MIHFGRRGRENLRALKRSDFAVSVDATGERFVYLTDERTKNHQDDESGAEGHMYEVKGDIKKTSISFKTEHRFCVVGTDF